MKAPKGATLLAILLCSFAQANDNHIVVIIPSYNNIKWYKKNLESLITQTYTNWNAIYIDDCSTDGTGQAVADFIDQYHLEHKITLIRNNTNKGGLYNLYHAIHSCNDNDIVVTYDGDDWFYDTNALTHVNDAYNDGKTWMTYGAYQEYPTGLFGATRSVPLDVIKRNGFREYEWITTHLRTFYAGLFKKINKEDLMTDGKFYAVTWDMAMMFPMLEMAGSHAKNLGHVAYVYNIDNPINDFKKDLSLVMKTNTLIRKKEKYHRLESL